MSMHFQSCVSWLDFVRWGISMSPHRTSVPVLTIRILTVALEYQYRPHRTTSTLPLVIFFESALGLIILNVIRSLTFVFRGGVQGYAITRCISLGQLGRVRWSPMSSAGSDGVRYSLMTSGWGPMESGVVWKSWMSGGTVLAGKQNTK